MKEENDCDSCGADSEVLMSTSKRFNPDGTVMWVCTDCFKEIEGVTFQDYGSLDNV